ncbi:hypothetical protein NQ318_002944 [Aromia moschata]|uniref:Methyltransferase-like 26 n=1 Tax=Aromia moschata TaxID=1265417 RepID=A0AAV8X864_9CUCU|nr:hypothetical protein NQ318_002944 [Aromia moschata]
MSKKIFYPSADRNKGPILEILKLHFDANVDGKVLEIASGTGQHAAHFASHFPRLTFQPSEYDATLLDSIRAYARSTPTKNVRDPLVIDVLDDWGAWGVGGDFDYALNVNMIHVTPLSCSAALFENVARALKPGGLLVTYGAYADGGVLEPQSNRDFDRSIRARDPRCGVRDVQELRRMAEPHGIGLLHVYELPANNKCLIWRKTAGNHP